MNRSGDKKKILVIEDDITLRDNISDYLEASNYRVISAGDGVEGFKKFKETLPDLVLCDIAMPKLDGFQLFEKIRSEPEYAEIPFIFLTAKIGISDFQKGMNLGADDYIIKPFNFEQLISIINNRISKREERLQFNIKKYQTLIENSLTGVFIHQNGKIIYCNSKFKNIFGLPDNIKDLEFRDIIDLPGLKELNRNIDACYNGSVKDFRIELKGIRKNGSDLFVEMFAGYSIFDNKKAVLGNVLDISERHEMEKKLKISEKRYRNLLSFTPISIHEVDSEGKITFVNNEVLRSSGYSMNEIIGKYVWDFSSDENNRKLTKEFFLNILKYKPKPKPAMVSVQNKEGQEQISEIYWDYTYDEEGNFKGLIVVLADVTEIEKSRMALVESEQKFKNLTEIASDWIWEINEKGYFTYASNKVFDVLGYMPEELEGKRPRDIMTKIELTRTIPFLENVARNKTPFKLHECDFIHKNKSKVTLEISGIPYYDNNGIFKGYRGVANDITDRNNSRMDLLLANSKLSSILNNIKSIVLYETGGENDFYSENIINLTGFSSGQFMTNKVSIEKLIHKSDLEEYLNNLNKWIISGDKYLKLRYRLLTQNGEYIYVEDYKSKFFTQDNNFYISGVLVDISERYEFEENIKRLKFAIDESPLGILILDNKYKLSYVNESFCKITGYTKEDFISNENIDLIIGRNDYLRNEFDNAIKMYGKYEGRQKSIRKNGDEYIEYFAVTTVKDPENNILNYVIIKQDITEIENIRKELAESKVRIEEEVNLRTLLLSNLSLEFRTPITVIFGYSEILKDEVESLRHKNMLAGIYSSAEKLNAILDSVVKLIQHDSLDANAEKKEMELIKEVISSADEYRQSAIAKKLYMNVNSKNESVKILGNPAIIRQIFCNIIDNAVKYTNEGGISIDIEKFTEGEAKFCVVRISDTGIGMSEEKQKNLFKDFKQSLKLLNSENEKIGLGLSLAKKMIEFHNGSITVDSIPGQCTTFSVVFPAI